MNDIEGTRASVSGEVLVPIVAELLGGVIHEAGETVREQIKGSASKIGSLSEVACEIVRETKGKDGSVRDNQGNEVTWESK